MLRFKEINSHGSEKLPVIREIADEIRFKRPELKELTNAEVVIIIDRKDEHLKGITRVVSGSTGVVAAALMLLGVGRDHVAQKVFDTVSEHREWFAVKIAENTEADFLIEEKSETIEERNLVVPQIEMQPAKVSVIAGSLGVPETFATGIDDILEGGFKSETLFDMIAEMLTILLRREETRDATAFDFSAPL
jgi:hypothetical protein